MIEADRIKIQAISLQDIARFSEYRDKEEVAEYQSWDEYPIEKAKQRITYCIKHPFHGKRGNYQLGIYLKDENYLIGDLFIEIDGHTTFTLGYTLDSLYWSKGYASEALEAILQYMYNIILRFVYVMSMKIMIAQLNYLQDMVLIEYINHGFIKMSYIEKC